MDFLDHFSLVDQIPMQICPGNHDIDKLHERNEIFLASISYVRSDMIFDIGPKTAQRSLN